MTAALCCPPPSFPSMLFFSLAPTLRCLAVLLWYELCEVVVRSESPLQPAACVLEVATLFAMHPGERGVLDQWICKHTSRPKAFSKDKAQTMWTHF